MSPNAVRESIEAPDRDPVRVAAIEATGLTKTYRERVAVDRVDLLVPEGSVLSLLGPNGAGKTTVVQILSTLTAPDAGEARVGGHDLRRNPQGVRSAIGVTGQFSAIDNYLTAEENLLLMADLSHMSKRDGRMRARELLELFDLADTGAKPAYAFSGGMQRRLDLAMTLVGSPRIIFLDEPTTGLDPRGRDAMWDLVHDLVRNAGVTVLLTTQYLDEADELADHVAVLDHGKIVAQGSAKELKNRVPGGHLLLTFTSTASLHAVQTQLPGAIADEAALTLQVPGDGSARTVRAVLDRIDPDAATQVSLHTPDLTDVFLALTDQNRKDRS